MKRNRQSSECLLMQPNRTEYNTNPHGKYALLVSATANIDIRVICEVESWNSELEELASYYQLGNRPS